MLLLQLLEQQLLRQLFLCQPLVLLAPQLLLLQLHRARPAQSVQLL
jgi:hypothetical protein